MEMSPQEKVELEKAFNIYCLTVLQNEAKNAFKTMEDWKNNEVSVSDFYDIETNLKSYDKYFAETSDDEKNFSVNGKIVSSEIITKAIHLLSDKCQQIVSLYYFCNMNDKEISELTNLPRSTVQRYRKKSIKIIKAYLEENI